MARLVLKKMQLENFKGVKNQNIEFGSKSTSIKGENGTGKSTIADAFYWVFADCNYALTKNPAITPLGESECISKVEMEMEIDGKPVTVSKSQKFKSKEDDNGKVVSSVTNSYAINSVEKAYRDFVADMTERGIDMDRFLIFSHPYAFIADTSKKGREDIRNTLFKMASELSDLDIAAGLDGISELNDLLKTYKLDEVEQIQKSTLKKIMEICGKDNSIINAKIDGMLSSKVSADADSLNARKTDLEKDIRELQDQQISIGDRKSEITSEISRLEKEKMQVLDRVNSDIKANLGALKAKLEHLENEKTVLCSEYGLAAMEVNRITSEINITENALNNWRKLYKDVQDESLNENDLKCPTCGTEYSANRIEEIKANFESSKNERLNSYKARGEETKEQLDSLQKSLEKAKERHSDIHKQIADLEKMKNKLGAEMSMSPAEVSKTEETDAIDSKIAELESDLKKDSSEIVESIIEQNHKKREELQDVIGQIAVVERNVEIDKKVETLREERRQAEINRANAEKILSQVERFKKYKNDRLSEDINSHFKIAQFRLFKVLKNGSIEEACDVLIDGKEINSQANQSLQVLARLDILRGLQEFFKEYYPVFCDDFALFTKNSEAKIEIYSQLIKLIATDGCKELVIEGGN